MRTSPWIGIIGILFVGLTANGQTPSAKLWTETKTKRDALPSLHQEFDVSQTYKTTYGNQSSHRQIIVDISQDKWRERTVSGSGERVRVFDGENLFLMEAGEDEFVRTKSKAKDLPAPAPYGSIELEWGKAKEVERGPCGFPTNDRPCVVVDVPVKPWTRLLSGSRTVRMSQGTTRLVMDTQTGMIVRSQTEE